MNLRSLLGTARRFRRSLPYLAHGTRFAWHYPVAPAIEGPPREPGPLEQYFDGVTEGPGIWKWRHYFDIYHRHFQQFVGREVHVVEIGIYSGGSLPMWRTYFGDRCHVYGIDIEEACRAYANEHTSIFIGDQADRAFWRAFRQSVPHVDIVIDDGGHLPNQQQVTIEELLPHLGPGGVYLCEDVQGFSNPFLGFVTGLAHVLNTDTREPLPVQQSVNSVHLYPFVVVVEKNAHRVDEFHAPKHGTQWQPFSPFGK